METHTLDRIFDPYFTTKENAEGNGLGLYIVREIVNHYQGHISVSSKPGKGTEFSVYLPRIDDKSTPGKNPIAFR